jgi:hypothetical protein
MDDSTRALSECPYIDQANNGVAIVRLCVREFVPANLETGGSAHIWFTPGCHATAYERTTTRREGKGDDNVNSRDNAYDNTGDGVSE